MAKVRKTESQIKRILKQASEGADIPKLTKRHDVSLGTFYNWKSRYGYPTAESSEPVEEAKANPAPAKKQPVKKAKASPAPAKKQAVKKAKPAAKASRVGRPKGSKKEGPRKYTKRVAPAAPKVSTSASTLSRIENRIRELEAEITKLKIEYADAALSGK